MYINEELKDKYNIDTTILKVYINLNNLFLIKLIFK